MHSSESSDVLDPINIINIDVENIPSEFNTRTSSIYLRDD